MKIARPDAGAKAFFRSMLPKDPRVTSKLVFGNDAAFVNGNMFFGIYGDDVFVRLPDDDAKELLSAEGSGGFEPVAGRVMAGYYTVPRSWKSHPEQVSKWVNRSLEWAAKLPKKTKSKKTRR